MGGLGSLVVRLGLDAAEFTGGLTKAEALALRSSKEMRRNIETINTALIGLGTAAVGAIYGLSKIIEKNAQLQDVAETIGDTAVNVSSLSAALAQSGADIGSVTDFSIKLTKALSTQDAEGKKAGAALKAIGLDFETLKKSSPVQQLEDIARALDTFEDGPEKTAVLEALAKGGAKLLPFLNDLADQTGRVSRLTAEQIANSNTYAESLGTLQGKVSALAQATAGDLAPAATGLVKILINTIDYLKDTSKQTSVLQSAFDGLKVVLQTVVVFGANVGFVLGGVGREIGGIAAQVAALSRRDGKAFRFIGDALKEDGVKARAELDKFEKAVFSVSEKTANKIRPNGKIDTSGLLGDGKKDAGVAEKVSDYEKLIAKVVEATALANRELDLGEKLTQQQTFARKIIIDAGQSKVKLTEKQLENLLLELNFLDSINKKNDLRERNRANEIAYSEYVGKLNAQEALDIEAATKAIEQRDKAASRGLFERIQNLTFENSLIGKNAQQRQLAIALNDLERSGIKSNTDAYKNAAIELDALISESTRLTEVQQSIEEISSAGRTLFENLLTGAEKPFDALKKLIKRDLIDQLYALTAKKWVIDIATNSTGGGGKSTGIIDSVFKLASSFFGSGKADGGPTQPGGIYPIIERGTPEVFTTGGKSFLLAGDKPGFVNNRVMGAQSSGGGASLSQNITIDARGADDGVETRLRAAIVQMGRDTIRSVQDMNRRSPAFLGR
jgi:hypothetical protein